MTTIGYGEQETAEQELGCVYPENPTTNDYERAKAKARQLLKTVVTEKEWEELEEKNALTIVGKKGIYVILPYSITQIFDSNSKRCTAYACLQLTIPAPTFDRMVAEYLLIKNDEEKYWKTANIFSRNRNEFEIATLFLIVFDVALFVNLFAEFLTTR